MTKAKLAAATVLFGFALGPTPAIAQETGFGHPGQVILSADRLFGLNFTNTTMEDAVTGSKQSQSRTNISLLWPPLTLDTLSPYTIPRVAGDFIVVAGLTVGGSIGFVRSTGKIKSEPVGTPSTERDADTITIFTFAPRIGYALAIAPGIAFWPRAGVTYYSFNVESTSTGPTPVTDSDTLKGFGLNLEPLFVFSPVPHFGITAGPVVDLPLSGSLSSETTPSTAPNPPDDKYRFTNFGLALGVLGYF